MEVKNMTKAVKMLREYPTLRESDSEKYVFLPSGKLMKPAMKGGKF